MNFIVSIHSNLVITVLSNVTNPWKCLISAFLHNLKVPNLNTTHSEIWDFKFYLDRNLWIFLSGFVLDGRKTKLGSHQKLFSTWELFDAPNHAVFIWNIFDCTNIRFENRRINIDWHWNNNFNIIGYGFLFELSPCFNHVLYFWFCEILNDWLYPYQRFNMRV